MTCATETRADTCRTKQSLRTTEMNILRTIVAKPRRGCIRNIVIRD